MINEFTKNIKESKNFTFVKLGDGEIDAMICREGVNCDNHAYSKELSVKIKEAFNELSNKKVYIADWFKSNPPITPRDLFNLQYFRRYIKDNKLNPNFVSPFELLLPGWGNFKNNDLFHFFKEIKLSNRNKIYVGPRVLEEVNQFLNIDKFVEIPKINAFDDHQRILSEIKTVLKDDSIIILTVGLMSPFVSNEILNSNPNVTVLDVGSGFDPLFIGQTRSGGQASPEESRAYYAELLALKNSAIQMEQKTGNDICKEEIMMQEYINSIIVPKDKLMFCDGLIFGNCNYATNGELFFIRGLPKNLVVFDVGSRNDSLFIKYKGEVHYFEPNPEHLSHLSALENNNLKSFYNEFGLSDSDEVLLYYPRYESFVNRFKSCGYDDASNARQLKLKCAENYMIENKIQTIDFLKIDVEGLEFKVLKGFGQNIKNIHVIQFEYGGTYIDANIKLREIINYLSGHGFSKFYYLCPHGLVLINDFSDHYNYCNIIASDNVFLH